MRVAVDDVRLYFDVEGPALVPGPDGMVERPTVVALHGGPGSDHASLRPDLSALSDDVQVLYLDQRGHGRSDRSTPDRWNLETWGDDVYGVCRALGVDRPVVFGVSFGGAVAVHYAARHPDHPAGLIVDSTAAREDIERQCAVFARRGGVEAAEAARRFLTDRTPESGAQYARLCLPLYLHERTPEEMAAVSARSIQSREVTMYLFRNRDTDLRPHLGRIRCPVLVMVGDDDPVATVDGARELVDLLPDATLKVVSNCGHAVFREQPDAAVSAMREFLRDRALWVSRTADNGWSDASAD